MARIVRIHEYGDPSVLKIEDIGLHNHDGRRCKPGSAAGYRSMGNLRRSRKRTRS